MKWKVSFRLGEAEEGAVGKRWLSARANDQTVSAHETSEKELLRKQIETPSVLRRSTRKGRPTRTPVWLGG